MNGAREAVGRPDGSDACRAWQSERRVRGHREDEQGAAPPPRGALHRGQRGGRGEGDGAVGAPGEPPGAGGGGEHVGQQHQPDRPGRAQRGNRVVGSDLEQAVQDRLQQCGDGDLGSGPPQSRRNGYRAGAESKDQGGKE